MTQTIALLVPFALAVSAMLLAVAVLLHVRQTRRRLDGIDVEGLARRLSAVEERTAEAERAVEACRKGGAEMQMRAKAIENDVAEVRTESARFLGIFKTVLYGFDYIVQGCKSALEISAPETPPAEKRITGEE
ncbi:MAG: hypothetical protein PHN82_07625 [bacterium]|nr:hypothetical protein [bacterium]